MSVSRTETCHFCLFVGSENGSPYDDRFSAAAVPAVERAGHRLSFEMMCLRVLPATLLAHGVKEGFPKRKSEEDVGEWCV